MDRQKGKGYSTMRVPFAKMTGAGNDFVVIDNRDGVIKDAPAAARKLCDRHWGIGADGLLLIETSAQAPYRMMYYNSDGSYGGMCGNGGRCIALYAVNHGLAGSSHTFEAIDHVYGATVASEGVTLVMKDPDRIRLDLVLPMEGKSLAASFVDTGAPHLLVFAEELGMSLDAIDVDTLGRKLRNHPALKPDGANVNFVEVVDDKLLKLRTYERGVEGETLACGTGSVATAVAACLQRGLRPPIRLQTKSGITLKVDFEIGDGKIRKTKLMGPAITVFEGHFDL